MPKILFPSQNSVTYLQLLKTAIALPKPKKNCCWR